MLSQPENHQFRIGVAVKDRVLSNAEMRMGGALLEPDFGAFSKQSAQTKTECWFNRLRWTAERDFEGVRLDGVTDANPRDLLLGATPGCFTFKRLLPVALDPVMLWHWAQNIEARN